MKNKSLIALSSILFTLTLTSCGLIDFNQVVVSLNSKKVEMFDLFEPNEEVDALAIRKNYIKDVTLKFYEDETLTPYITLEDYFSMLPWNKDCSFSNTQILAQQYIRATAGNTTVFAFIVDYNAKEIIVGGSLDEALDNGQKEYTESLTVMQNLFLRTEVIFEGLNGFAQYSYKGYGINTFKEGGKYYFPLSFLDTNISNYSNLFFFYNNKNLYRYKDRKSLNNYYFKDNSGVVLTAEKEYKNSLSSQDMPEYLIRYNLETYMYMMENMYGLKYNRKIKNMREYLKQLGYYDDLSSPNPDIRGLAYSNSINKLNDDHSGLLISPLAGVYNETVSNERGDVSKDRKELEDTLTEARKAAYEQKGRGVEGGILYSQDEKTATFVFDSFEADTIENVKRGEFLHDSAELLKVQFDNIKLKNVKNVVIDMSTNGGGLLIVMLKTLALCSKNNAGTVVIQDPTTNFAAEYEAAYDTNQDGKYDRSDCYGDDFNIFLLTSSCSFSCGNAFPYIAKLMGNVKIIGKRTGGGECAVAQHVLPNQQHIQISSNNHITFQKDDGSYYDFESGIAPDAEISYDDFYDIEALNTICNRLN